jgi:hypothetical protein
MVMIQSEVPKLINTVLNPQGKPLPGKKDLSAVVPVDPSDKPSDNKNPAPRLDTLKGKTVYLVDGRFGGSYDFLIQMKNWFAENMPEVNTVLKRKSNNMFMDEPELWAEIKEKGDAMILGVGG